MISSKFYHMSFRMQQVHPVTTTLRISFDIFYSENEKINLQQNGSLLTLVFNCVVNVYYKQVLFSL